eukprot:5308615-Prymnesium_polylepis.1
MRGRTGRVVPPCMDERVVPCAPPWTDELAGQSAPLCTIERVVLCAPPWTNELAEQSAPLPCRVAVGRRAHGDRGRLFRGCVNG